jgi:hypothetical protein
MSEVLSLPFGRHRNQPLTTVPSAYLTWCLSACKLSSGLRAAVANELANRGIEAAPPPERPEPRCLSHPTAGVIASWKRDRAGRPYIRGECAECRNWLGALPQTERFIRMAAAQQKEMVSL